MSKLFNEVISFKELYDSLKKTSRGVKWKDSVAGYVMNSLKNTYKLRNDILNDSYKIDPYHTFNIHEPKEREIVATRIKDRQFQRSLCDNILYPQVSKTFIRDSCACQIGKGVDDALDRLETHMHRYYRKYGSDGYVLKCDISHFFQSTRHDIACEAIRKRVDDDLAYKYAEQIINSFGKDGVGIGLGSQVSQITELAVLDDLDHYIKECLHIKYYIRYMDDFILIHNDRDYLNYCLNEIRQQLDQIGLTLNDKTQIYSLKQGIVFLKWHFYLTNTGKVIRRMSDRSIAKERRKLKKFAVKVANGEMDMGAVSDSFQSWRANAQRGDTKAIVFKMEKYYKQLFGVNAPGKE